MNEPGGVGWGGGRGGVAECICVCVVLCVSLCQCCPVCVRHSIFYVCVTCCDLDVTICHKLELITLILCM